MNNERCTRCGGLMTFCGFTTRGQRVLFCAWNLTDKKAGSVPCNPTEDFYVVGELKPMKEGNVAWHMRADEQWQRR